MYGSTTQVPYDADMARRKLMGVNDARKFFAQRIKLAEETGEQTVVTRHGDPVAAIVPMDWLRRAADALGEPTDL